MFTFTDRYTFKWPVKVKLPASDGEVVQEFTGEFLLPADELSIFETFDADGPTDMVAKARERLARLWIGWEGISVEDGGELPFSSDARDRLLRQRPVRMAVDIALSEAVLGIREKN